ncbi:amino acid ABC transporter ATP-binding/permease protein [Actinotignum timonense]|uniref:amino acid ABC transporter ATP-binding/permease protein n=1 Tax=Actinotignum schaalii TaxID=59505 RepID=UPI0003F8E488|nr:ABC transporter ATP-binding protein [Actinotignum schaalii]WQN45552.1 ABC transporter ATP-binding protein [Actinotignum schaalii]
MFTLSNSAAREANGTVLRGNGAREADGAVRVTNGAAPGLRTVLRWLLSLTRPVHGPLALSTLCRAAGQVGDIGLFAVATYGMVAAVSSGGGAGFLWFVALLALLKAALRYLEQFTGHYVAFRALELLRTRVFASLWPKAPGIMARSRSGDIVASLTRDIDRIEVVYAHTVAPVVCAYVLTPTALLVGGALLGWSAMALPAVAAALALAVIPYAGTRRAIDATTAQLAARADLAAHVTDSLYGLEDVLVFGRTADRVHETAALGAKVTAGGSFPAWVAGLRRGANIIAAGMSAAWIIAVGVSDPSISLPLAAAGAVAALRVWEGPQALEDAASSLDASLAAARRIYALAHAPQPCPDGPGILMPERGLSVEFDDVHYAYPEREREVLRGVSLRIPAGSHTVLAGRSGSGKSTLVHLVERYDDPTSGTVRIGGIPTTDLNVSSLHACVVGVSQKSQIVAGSIADNLRLGVPKATETELWRALGVAGLDSDVRAMPEGLNTRVGGGTSHGRPTGYALSGGQVQRLCLARAVLMHPAVLILDEFAAALNSELETRIRANLRAALPEATLIEVSHRLDAVREADTVAVLSGGRLVLAGPPAEVTEARVRAAVRENGAAARENGAAVDGAAHRDAAEDTAAQPETTAENAPRAPRH